MRSKRISAEKQYGLIMECRQDKLTDSQQCVERDIKPGTFYRWVRRLRQKACIDLPASIGRSYIIPEIVDAANKRKRKILLHYS